MTEPATLQQALARFLNPAGLDRQRQRVCHHPTTGRNAIEHDVTPYQHNGLGYPARSRAAAAIVPAMDFDQQARYVGVNWARRRLGS
ncbi:hypothetical protein CR157_10440 [Halomonas sp. LBP4]|nr:hypothetical protein CR157_10440 [Halomonas sp. LBP4]